MSKQVLCDSSIKIAVMLWFGNDENRNKCIETYGHISDWDVSKVKDMCYLFSSNVLNANTYDFNEDISNWDMENVIFVSGMFEGCVKFNQDLKKWKLNSLTTSQIMWTSNTELSIENVHKLLLNEFEFGKSMELNNMPTISMECIKNTIDILKERTQEMNNIERNIRSGQMQNN
jgi:hypothetical protein